VTVDDLDDRPTLEREALRLCACGCSEAEHDEAGRCVYCGSEDCGGFTYDEDATIVMLAIGDEYTP
jgi:hypothetical protein